MSVLDPVLRFLAEHQVPSRQLSVDSYPAIDAQLDTVIRTRYGGPVWRQPTIRDALGHPGILRAVTLISNTTGSLSIQGYRNGLEMEDPPRVIVRPDPDQTPRDFYRDSAFNMASRGEVVWWIASRDGDGNANALVVVPLNELTVEDNPRNRRRATYRWGDKESTRWTPTNPTGQFVHVTYLKEPGELRGVGPLQLCGAATSVTVEAQQWAANFYSTGGNPSVNLHSTVDLEDGEAEAARNQWTSTPMNTPQVTSGEWELREVPVNPQGAQMLDAREYQNGDAARMYGIPGTLLEYSSPGSSLTYQNITEVFTLFVKTCLAPNYLEPIEQAISDLLTRSTVARFNVKGFERADAKTRWEIYQLAVEVLGPIEAAEWARKQEGFTPGDVEFAPVPFAAPAAEPVSLPARLSRQVRCDGTRLLRGRMVACGRLLSESGTFSGHCPRCKKEFVAA